MSWSVYDGPLEFRVGPSRGLAAWLVPGHLVIGLALLDAGLTWALPAVPVAFLVALRRALDPLGRGTRAIRWSAARGWERVGISTNRERMELRGTSVVTNVALFLHWKVSGTTWRIVLPRDAVRADDWRRMRVIVGLYEGRDRMPPAAGIATPAGRTSGTAPGLSEWRMDSPGFRGACPNGRERQRPVAGREGPAR